MGLFSRKKKNNGEECNICSTIMDVKFLWSCPNCGNAEGKEVCSVCNSDMNKYRLFTCPNCGNTIDEDTLEKKRKIKQKFEDIT